jgi:hypothetical protein
MKVETFVATPSDVVRFNKTQLRRAKTNLVNALKRGDKRAVANIQRKMTIYQYTVDMAQQYISEGEYINKQIAEAGD